MNKKSILLLLLIAGLNVSNIQPNRFDIQPNRFENFLNYLLFLLHQKEFGF